MSERNINTLKEALHAMVEHYRLKGRLSEVRIKEIWKEQMNPLILNYTRDFSIRRRVLYLRIDSAPLRQELSVNREMIRRNLNEALGEDYLLEVVVR